MLYQLLEQIHQKPALYLNAKSVINLDVFLLGFMAAKSVYHLPGDPDEEDFAGFRDWVATHYNIYSHQSWAQIIRFFAKDDAESFELFFRLLGEYRQKPAVKERFTNEMPVHFVTAEKLVEAI